MNARHIWGVAWTWYTSRHEHGRLLRYPAEIGHLEVRIAYTFHFSSSSHPLDLDTANFKC